MSLVTDFAHYYNGTWIAQRNGDINNPIYINSVDQNAPYSRDDFSHEAEQALVFYGDRWSKEPDGSFRSEAIVIPIFDPSLILESPDVGYLLHSRNVVSWTHINPVRQRAKGLMGNKLRTGPSVGRGIPGEMVYNLFNPTFDGLVTRFIYINPNDYNVYYKGARVGRVQNDVGRDRRGRLHLTLLDKFKHISSDLERDYAIELVASL